LSSPDIIEGEEDWEVEQILVNGILVAEEAAIPGQMDGYLPGHDQGGG